MHLGFTSERLAQLARMERWHFWFVGRRALIDGLLDRHVVRPEPRVLDLGCGTGLMLQRLERRGCRAVGVDMRPEGLRHLRQASPGSPTVQADATHLPFAGDSFDALLLLDIVEHVDDRALLAEVRRVLRPGGVAVLTVPAFPWLWSYRDEAAGHLRRYTRRGLMGSLAGAGLAIREVRYYQFLLFPLVVVSRWLGRRGAAMRDAEERPGGALNALLSRVNRAEAALGRFVPWPWGSSLAAVCVKE
ncbi:MAG TPA: class I SAM-dependent methyltransferase [Longimicrobium sp.]|jgi:SAM-dependent methyltransferase